MDIHVQLGAGKCIEFVPSEQQGFLDLAPDSEGPVLQVQLWHRAVMQDWKPFRQVLPRRQTFFCFRI